MFRKPNGLVCVQICARGQHSVAVRVSFRYIHKGLRQSGQSTRNSVHLQVVMTSDEHHLVCYDADKLKPNLYIHRSVSLRIQG